MGKESTFESEFKKDIENLGGICLKFKSTESGGMDRVILMPFGFTYWAEIKRPDGKGVVSKLQKYQRSRFTDLGHQVWLIDCSKAKEKFIRKVKDDLYIL